MRAFEYRLYPNREQYALLLACLERSRLIYNEMLAKTKYHHQQFGRFFSKYELDDAFKGSGEDAVPATTVQALADRLDKALRHYFAQKREGKATGFPRFKPKNRWHSIQLRQYAIGRDCWLAADGAHLHVPAKLGKALKIKLHRPLEGMPQTAHLVLRADGHWYAVIICKTSEEQERARVHLENSACAHPDVGLDMGIKVFLADSEGNTVANPRFYRKSARRLRHHRQRRNRRRKGSQRQRKAAHALAKAHLKIRRQHRDFCFKTARPYAERYRRICVEDLNIRGMMRQFPFLVIDIRDAGWRQFLTILEDKAERAGHQVIRVPAFFTSQQCNGCGALVSKSLSVRTHVCPTCSYVEDRDVNAAKNILRAGAPPSGTIAPPDDRMN